MVAAQFRVEMKITSASDLKNVNWRGCGQLRPYAAVWVDDDSKQYTYVAADAGGGSYSWANQTLFVPFTTYADGTILNIQFFHQSDPNDDTETKTIVGSNRIDLFKLVCDINLSRQWHDRSCYLARDTGRPQGLAIIKVRIRRLGPEEEVDVGEEDYYEPEAM